MKRIVFFSIVLLTVWLHAAPAGRAKEPRPIGWAYAGNGPVKVRAGPSDRKPAFTELGRGALVEVYESVTKGNVPWSRARVIDFETLSPRMGWLESRQMESIPLDRFPTDADLLKEIGGAYLDDFVSSHTEIARFLIRQGNEEAALACLLVSPALPQTRLQLLRRSEGKFVPSAFLEFPSSETKTGITVLEIRDLVGDGNECLVTREPFDLGLENRGAKMVIRRVEGGELKSIWEAPLEHRNLSSFPPKIRTLQPPEKNIGEPGTVTTGTVDFLARGSVHEPVWKGKVEFYVVGREAPVNSTRFEKTCAWQGTKFAPLR